MNLLLFQGLMYWSKKIFPIFSFYLLCYQLLTNSSASLSKTEAVWGDVPCLIIIKATKPPAPSPIFSAFPPITMQAVPSLLSKTNFSSSALDPFFSPRSRTLLLHYPLLYSIITPSLVISKIGHGTFNLKNIKQTKTLASLLSSLQTLLLSVLCYLHHETSKHATYRPYFFTFIHSTTHSMALRPEYACGLLCLHILGCNLFISPPK